MPTRLQTSSPTATARSSSGPLRPRASATAIAAGTIDELGCSTEGRWVSSKSSECASVPLISAADDAGSFPPPVSGVASGVPPRARMTRSMARNGAAGSSTAVAASETPTLSVTRLAASSVIWPGRSPAEATANSASTRA
jgi:hypothetical protein